MNQYDRIRHQLRLMELESENDQESVARNLLTEQEAQARAELRGMQRENISWWLTKNGEEDGNNSN
mgnify:CR=1 FL=1